MSKSGTTSKLLMKAYLPLKTSTRQDQHAAIEDFLSRKFWRSGMSILIDHRKLDFGRTNISMLQQISLFHQKNDARIGNGRIAILVKSLADFGRGRQFELLTWEKISAKLEVFLEEEKAFDWLLKNWLQTDLPNFSALLFYWTKRLFCLIISECQSSWKVQLNEAAPGEPRR